tara:strand:- start:6003 stop:9071 length:3069 start_codon:yes stop_codon:yes gene_type:complete
MILNTNEGTDSGRIIIYDGSTGDIGIDPKGNVVVNDGDIELKPTTISTAHIKVPAGSLDIRCANNMKIGTDGADSIRIGRENTTAAKVHIRSGSDDDLVVSNGKVGIGMNDPSDALEIDGDIQLTPTAISTAHLKTSGSLDIRATGNLKIGTDGADSVRIGRDNTTAAKVHVRSGSDDDLVVSNSKVGIGTDSPAHELDVVGDVQVSGDIILDDGGSIKEAGGTAAITIDGSGHVTKIGQDSPSSADVLTYDGSKWVAEAPTAGDITGVTAGNGISGGGSSGGVTVTLDISDSSLTTATEISSSDLLAFSDEDVTDDPTKNITAANLMKHIGVCLSAGTVAVADDHLVFLDGGATEDAKTESIADLVSGIAGTASSTGLSASSGVLSVSDLHPVGVSGANNQLLTDDGDGTVTSESGLTYDGSTLEVTGDIEASGGDLAFGNGQNATVSIEATAHGAAGKSLTISGGSTTAGTTNNIAGGSVTIAAGQGKGSGNGGDIVFKTANAGGSGSSLNALATALTISDDLSSTFNGPVSVVATESAEAKITLSADEADDNGDTWVVSATTDGHFLIESKVSGSLADMLDIHPDATATDSEMVVSGSVQVTGTGYKGPTDGDLTIQSDGHMTFIIDNDNDETGQHFYWKNNASTTIAELTESGELELSGKIASTGVVTGQARKTANYSLTDADHTILAARSTTMSLPENSAAGTTFTIKRVDDGTSNGTITISRSGSDTIDGSASYTLTSNYDSVTVVSDGADYHIVSEPSAAAGTATDSGVLVDISHFDPVKLQPIATLLDADEGVTESSGAVGDWDDQGPNEDAFEQSSAGSKPTVVSSAYNGQKCIRFDGSNDVLVATSTDLYSTSLGHTVFLVAKSDSTSQDAHIAGLGDGNGADDEFEWGSGFYITAGKYGVKACNHSSGKAGEYLTQTSSATSNLTLVSGKLVTGDCLLRINGATEKVSTATINEFSGYSATGIGGGVDTSSGATYFDGDICFYLHVNRSMSMAEIEAVEAYLANRYGITLS